MSIQRVATIALAVVWCAVAFLVIGTAPLATTVRSITGAGPAPSAGTFAALVVWCAAVVFAFLAILETGWWLARRQPRIRLDTPVVVLAIGAVLLAAGLVAQVDSYRVCCTPVQAAAPR